MIGGCVVVMAMAADGVGQELIGQVTYEDKQSPLT